MDNFIFVTNCQIFIFSSFFASFTDHSPSSFIILFFLIFLIFLSGRRSNRWGLTYFTFIIFTFIITYFIYYIYPFILSSYHPTILSSYHPIIVYIVIFYQEANEMVLVWRVSSSRTLILMPMAINSWKRSLQA